MVSPLLTPLQSPGVGPISVAALGKAIVIFVLNLAIGAAILTYAPRDWDDRVLAAAHRDVGHAAVNGFFGFVGLVMTILILLGVLGLLAVVPLAAILFGFGIVGTPLGTVVMGQQLIRSPRTVSRRARQARDDLVGRVRSIRLTIVGRIAAIRSDDATATASGDGASVTGTGGEQGTTPHEMAGDENTTARNTERESESPSADGGNERASESKMLDGRLVPLVIGSAVFASLSTAGFLGGVGMLLIASPGIGGLLRAIIETVSPTNDGMNRYE